MQDAVIIEAVRTPFGKRGGCFRDTRPASLLAHVLSAVMERSGLPSDRVEDVICGTVSQAGEQGANIGRLGSLLAGFPPEVPGVTLNRMCGSGQQAVHFASQAIAAGDAQYVVACGVESMTRVPMFLDLTLGPPFRDFSSLNPELLARYPLVHQAESAERLATLYSMTRSECDAMARESHRRAHAARDAGHFKEIVPTPARTAGGAPLLASGDEGVRAVIDEAKIAALPLLFRPPGQGVITAANSSQMSDGAAAVLIGEAARARSDGLRIRARFRARVAIGSDPVIQFTGVAAATKLALRRAGLSMADLDWIEINEAFAPAVIAWAREMEPDMSKVNPWGGAMAHGHPLGATAAGLLAKSLSGLEHSGGQFGLVTACIGHGMATATIIERVH